jgi:hypothetical protein
MSLFRKFFGSNNPASDEEKENENSEFYSNIETPLDEQFIFNFKRNGGKFLYCENAIEVKDQLENILEENDWFESEALCYESVIFHMLEENKVTFDKPKNPSFFIASCENLIADEGSILFSSKQIKQQKPNELPTNIIILAKTSQIIGSKSDGLSVIKKKYVTDYPTNITAMKYFEKVEDEDFTQYGSTAKNLYLLLLEDL